MKRTLLFIRIIIFLFFLLSKAGAQTQTVINGAQTTAANFSDSGCAYNWTNNTPAIGLAASGTGNIPSFTAVNTGSTPVTATITAMPVPTAFAYIANSGDGTVSVINTGTKTVIATIPVDSNPFGASVSQDGNFVYITNKGSNSVSVINTSTNAVTATINVGAAPEGIAVSPDGTRVYVANSIDNTISVISTSNNTILTVIPVGLAPYGVTISPDGTKVYVANYSSNTISVINTSSASVTATISGFINPSGVALSPDGSKLYVSNSGFDTVTILNTASNLIITQLQVTGRPVGIAVSPDGARVYVAVESGYFTTIFTSDNTTSSFAWDSPISVSVTPDGSSIYLVPNGGSAIDFVSSTNLNNAGQITVKTHPNSFGNFISKGPGCNSVPVTFTITVNNSPPIVSLPNISYQTPQTYTINKPITPLVPKNTGGYVPAIVYGQVTHLAPFEWGPLGIAIDANGNIFEADNSSNQVIKITPSGNAVPLPYTFKDSESVAIDANDNIYVGDVTAKIVYKIAPNGVETVFANVCALALTIDAHGNLYAIDSIDGFIIKKITPGGVVTTLAGNGLQGSTDGSGTQASFYEPRGLAVDASGNVYVADMMNNKIRKISPSGVVTTFAGSGVAGSNDGMGTSATFYSPVSVAIDAGGNVYVVDAQNELIRKISPSGLVTTLPGNFSSFGIAFDANGNFYTTNPAGHKIDQINLTGYTIDKPLPSGLTFDSATGIISGTPTVLSPAINYTVTAYNGGGSSSTVVYIAVTGTLPIITTGTATGIISACSGSPSSSPNLQQFIVNGNNLTSDIAIKAPSGFEISLNPGIGYSTSITLNQTGGSVNKTTIYVRSAASDPPGNVSGVVTLTSAGATSQNVSVAGLVTAFPSVNPVSDQIIVNGTATNAVNFTGTANTYTWVNDNPNIGLPAKGSGNIASFTAVDAGTTPITGKITVTPQNAGFAYIANTLSGTVSVINTITNTVATTIQVGEHPYTIAASQDGRRVYVANKYISNGTSSTLSVINTAANTVIATISTGADPWDVAVSPDGSWVYVTDQSDKITVINTATNMVVSTIKAGVFLFGMVISPDGSKLYAADQGNNSIEVIDLKSNKLVSSIPSINIPLYMVISPDGNSLYVTGTDPASNVLNARAVYVINTTTNSLVTTIPVGTNAIGITITPDGKKVYVSNTNTNNVSVINTFTNAIETTIAVGTTPEGISTSPDGTLVYVVNSASNNVSVINTVSNLVIATVPVQDFPQSFGNFIISGTGCNGVPVSFNITVTPKPAITTGGLTGSISACAGSPSSDPDVEQFSVNGTGLTSNIVAVAPTNFEISLSAGGNYSTTITLAPSANVVNAFIYVRSAASASGQISGNITLTSSGATTQYISVSGVVNPLATIDPVVNQTFTNGTPTPAINLTGKATGFNWVNSNTGIGLSASGTGDIPSFTPVNTTKVPVTATITVTPEYDKFAYIANSGSGTVSVINTSTNKMVSTINVGNNPYSVVVNADGSRVYVSNNLDGTVSVINPFLNAAIATVKVGVLPLNLCLNPDGSLLYVVDGEGGSISVINTATNTVSSTYSIPGSNIAPFRGIAVSPDGKKLYMSNIAVTNVPQTNQNTVSVYDAASFSLLTNIPVGATQVDWL